VGSSAAPPVSYRIDKWANQSARVEVWVEKEALAGIVQRAADARDVDWFACRGYVSQSELWAAGQRHLDYLLNGGQRVVVLHLGDHDPSGIDMTRDIGDRLRTFVYSDWLREHSAEFGSEGSYSAIEDHIDDTVDLDGHDPIEVRRIALNMDQVEQYDPPPNPTKLTDSRSTAYIDQYGPESWELDALDPTVLGDLIAEHLDAVIDPDLYDELVDREASTPTYTTSSSTGKPRPRPIRRARRQGSRRARQPGDPVQPLRRGRGLPRRRGVEVRDALIR